MVGFLAIATRLGLLSCLLLSSSLFPHVSAQSTSIATTASGQTASTSSPSSNLAATTTTTPSITIFPVTTSVTFASVSQSGSQNVTIATVVPTAYNVTSTFASPTATSSTTSSSTPTPIVLDTKITPAFGVLGAILVLTGLPSAFWGHKNRWTSFFLIGFYSFALVCFVLIAKFGILPAVNPPGATLQGMFVLSCAISGIMGGALSIFFWKATKYFIGAWGGFAIGLWLQCFKDGGLITPVGIRYILYISCGVVGFVLCTIPKIHWHILLLATAFVGSSVFMLGVDCYTTAGLKEFYVWNLGFTGMFPKYTGNGIAFPVSQTMQIELGLVGAVALMGGAVQLRILRVLQRKLKEIAEEQRRRDEEAELDASGRFADLEKERKEWENDHPPLGMHARTGSGYSGTPLMNDFPTSSSNEGPSSTQTLTGGRGRYTSGVSDFLAAPVPEDDVKRTTKGYLQKGLLPNLDLGAGIQDDVPTGFITATEPESKESKAANEAKKAEISAELEALSHKEELLAEIQTIRRSIDALRSDTPGVDSDDSRSRRISLSSKRTLSCDLDTVAGARPHARPPRQPDPRVRTHSMEFSKVIDAPPLGASISRPTSVPLKNEDWDSYVQDRKLLQPPSGVTVPIPTTPMSSRLPMPAAVNEALSQRKRRESSLLELGSNEMMPKDASEEDLPISSLTGMKLQAKQKGPRTSGNIPPVLLQPPGSAPAPEPSPSGVPLIFTRPRPIKATSAEVTNSNIPTVLPPSRLLKGAAPDTSINTAYVTPRGGTAKPEPQRVATFEELEERHRQKLKGLQAPLTQAEKEHAEVEAAKSRWERSRAIEREVVNKRQAEKAAQLEREEKGRRKSQDGLGKRGSTLLDSGKAGDRGSSTLNAEKLAVIGGKSSPSSKRQSIMRVEDWQRHQQDAEMGVRPDASSSQRDSRMMAHATVPFPGQSRMRDKGSEKRRASGSPRDPPN
ncbi:hypothetical protein EDC04DRAFT_15946 [Pisolithus marmoratus]|nr:hypothetical protein EDC04DRAFT_15946 [Pisolithus marmoratus]